MATILTPAHVILVFDFKNQCRTSKNCVLAPRFLTFFFPCITKAEYVTVVVDIEHIAKALNKPHMYS